MQSISTCAQCLSATALALAATLSGAAPAGAQSGETGTDAGAANATHAGRAPVARAAPAGAITLDGALDEAAWQAAVPATDFRQRDPDDGEPATQRTEVRFLVGADALYVGARMYDELGAEGVRTRLARRDQDAGGDYLELTFDTYHDHNGVTELRINPSGVKVDAGQASSYADPSWDPVWQAETRIDSLGWTAEMRIPLSQLRFPPDVEQTWGLQVWRYVERLNEISMWSYWDKDTSGGPSLYGHLAGMRIEERPRGLEVMPYAVSRASYVTPSDPESPFESDRDYDWRFGADVKALLTSNLTLSATVNPDFGQVEVDPAVVNLSAYETFFDEKRPFFVEGSGVLGFGGLNCRFCSNVSGMSLFYSRRIGRRPQGSLPGDALYTESLDNTAIVGAAKLTGQFDGGWQIAALDAVTGSEKARYVLPGDERLSREVEPATNYFVGRVLRNFRGGNARVGAMATSVVRRFGFDSLSHRLPSHAEALGVDWDLRFRRREYRLMGNVAASQVSGDAAAIDRLQRSSARYFDRPDRDHGSNGLFSDRYDPDATVLRGWGGYLRLSDDAGPWQWEAQTNVRSPGFEVNDLAFLTRADYVWSNANLVRRWNEPNRWYRYLQFLVGGQQQVNFDGDVTDRQAQLSGYVELPNYWSGGAFVLHRPRVLDDRRLRGGPVVSRAASWYASGHMNTDGRKPVVFGMSGGRGWTEEGGHATDVSADVELKPASNVTVSFGPSYYAGESVAQYVDAFDDPSATAFFGRRVVFAGLSQRTLSMNTRLAWVFSPTMSLELFAQPFVSTGDYEGFVEFDRPRALDKNEFGDDRLTVVRSPEGEIEEYRIDADGDPATEPLVVDNPDFNFRSLRGNAVFRWEYRPGSTLFLVWQQDRSGDGVPGRWDFTDDAVAPFRERPDNVFVVKVSYWWGR